MSKVIILGSGAAPGVPSLCQGWGGCNPNNPKNRRLRCSTYMDFNNVHILIDTSPDLRCQLLENNITSLDAVLYTHTHADHLNGIDDLREINRISGQSINFYGVKDTVKVIRKRFDYLITSPKKVKDVIRQPSLIANVVKNNKVFYIKDVKVEPIKLLGHNVPTTGYIFNDNEVIYLSDFRAIDMTSMKEICTSPKLLILPLTTPYGQTFHAGLEEVLDCIKKINPDRVIINHMASECDYDAINTQTPDFVEPAYDGLIINI